MAANDATGPGTTLGNYRIERLLGRGGMGAVFLAFDTVLHRQVALKVLDERANARRRTPGCFERPATRPH